ncbi:MAG: YihA family ribosome biogenesis GTP-binding protein [[Eubacterium] sulci]|jgi:ribosome biogenesis GTP-binding protein ysxC|nr:YihA family ribosome biogenesis GTP-binding protein [[Eubacterium] sulci]MBF1151371.1 YihA family ribosome biogenesis GTP-binding protein [[Eubacterium] sulci]MBF1160323.1 YihA family ribosome biogenesis GTP-binding protein [[Eubacterium] sulci]
MRIIRSELEAVAVRPNQYPDASLDEIAFVGRSNVGKSSLLNLLTNRKSLARVSGNPGKTRTINFYLINDAFRFVDLPGYGYAKVSKSITADWDRMMDDFFKQRKNLKRVVQLVDIRHEPSKLDVQMYEYLRSYGLDGLVCATKADKISGNQKQKNLSIIRKNLNLGKEDKIVPVSALKKTGHDVLLDYIAEELGIE